MVCLENKVVYQSPKPRSGQSSHTFRTESLVFNSQKKSERSSGENSITIKVKSFADPIFLALRLIDGFSSDKLSETLDLSLNSRSIQQAGESLGASGSFFFFSFDNKLVIKTITEKESNILLEILPEFYLHIARNPLSLLSRVYGLFSIEIVGVSKINFIMMENTVRVLKENNIAFKKYDLKGSTIQREVKNPTNIDVLKDINLLNGDDAFLFMTPLRKEQLVNQIDEDIRLLMKQNIMDYSLLLAVGPHKKNQENGNPPADSQLGMAYNEWRCFDDGHELSGKIYSISLIDFLQVFDWNKWIELTLKKVFKGGGDISSVDASTYYKRFLKFVKQIVVTYKF
jgi:1-phosphatidylinositol-4-phosphate 5-kinase